MYCPKCGNQNTEETKYCRSCGENLQAISQVMKSRLPVLLASKLDAYLERRNELIRRDGIVSALSGMVFLLMGIANRIWGDGGWSGFGVPMFLACFMLLSSFWNYLAYQRSLSVIPASQRKNSPNTKELPVLKLTQMTSVTEGATRQFDPPVRREEESRSNCQVSQTPEK